MSLGRVREYNIPTGIMDDVFNYSTDVAVTFCKIEITQTGRFFVVMGVRFELEDRFFQCLSLLGLEGRETYDGM